MRKKNDVNWEITGLLNGLEGGDRIVLMQTLDRIDYSLFKHESSYCVAPTVASIFKKLFNHVGNNKMVRLARYIDVDAIVRKLSELYNSDLLRDLDEFFNSFPDTEKLTVDMLVDHFVSQSIMNYHKARASGDEMVHILRSPDDDVSTR